MRKQVFQVLAIDAVPQILYYLPLYSLKSRTPSQIMYFLTSRTQAVVTEGTTESF